MPEAPEKNPGEIKNLLDDLAENRGPSYEEDIRADERRKVQQDLLAAARSCTMCGEIHQRHPAKSADGTSYMSWGHPEDGHAYFQASQEAAAWLARRLGEDQ